MATKYVTELKELGQLLADEGWEMRASIVNTAAERMERLEKYITDMHADLHPDTVPPKAQ